MSQEYLSTGAMLSNCGRYRYSLSRTWQLATPIAVVIGLNPSTADAKHDDPTIRRCVEFAKRWGCGKLEMLNLFAFRATDPREMLAAADPVGPQNDSVIASISEDARVVVAAWGALGVRCGREAAVIALLEERAAGVALKCLGLTKHGAPRHPLYVRGDTPLMPFASRSSPNAGTPES